MRYELKELQDKYGNQDSFTNKGTSIKNLYLKYFGENKSAFVDSLTSAVALDSIFADNINYDEIRSI